MMKYSFFKNQIQRSDSKANNSVHFFASKFAPRISYLAHKLGITGDQMTIIFFLTGVISSFVLRNPGIIYSVIGYILFRLHIIFDMCDGNLARINKSFSKRGVYWDSMAHNIINPLIVMNITHSIFKQTDDIRFYYIQGPLILIIALTSAVKNNYYKALYNWNQPEKVGEIQQKNSITKFIFYLTSEVIGMEGIILFPFLYHLLNFSNNLALVILIFFALGNSCVVLIKFLLLSYTQKRIKKI